MAVVVVVVVVILFATNQWTCFHFCRIYLFGKFVRHFNFYLGVSMSDVSRPHQKTLKVYAILHFGLGCRLLGAESEGKGHRKSDVEFNFDQNTSRSVLLESFWFWNSHACLYACVIPLAAFRTHFFRRLQSVRLLWNKSQYHWLDLKNKTFCVLAK